MNKTKNNVQLLHEFCQYYGYELDFIEEASEKVCEFHFSAQINKESIASGSGRSKKDAKIKASQKALNVLFDIDMNVDISTVPCQINYDSAGNSVTHTNPSLELDEDIEHATLGTVKASKSELSNSAHKFLKFCLFNNEGYSILVKHYPKDNTQYIIQFFFNNVCIGSGVDNFIPNAYNLAAYEAYEMISEGLSSLDVNNLKIKAKAVDNANGTVQAGENGTAEAPKLAPDSDAQVMIDILNQFLSELKNNIPPEVKISQSISAFFVKNDKGINLVSFACGSGIVDVRFLANNGQVITNSHSLSVAHRALKRYLMFEICTFCSKKENSNSLNILEFEGDKLILKENVEFILLMTKSPCGDTTAIDTAAKVIFTSFYLHYN